MMKPIYVGDDFNPERPSIFLAGPSPRSKVTSTWRDEALFTLQRRDFQGDVYVPMTKERGYLYDYKEQVRWERKALGAASCTVFWVPRSEALPGFTTNVEFGMMSMVRPGRVVLGAPETATKIRYLKMMARESALLGQLLGVELAVTPVLKTLEKTLEIAHQTVQPENLK